MMDSVLTSLKQNFDHSETPEERAYYETPERGERGLSCLVLFPKTTRDVQHITRTCYDHDIPMLPQGARTGMVGGSTPDPRGDNPPVIISTAKMNRIFGINALHGTAHVQAGVAIATLNETAEEKRVFFPIKVAGGAPHIGGAIATNAGGGNFLLYGGVREQVLGLEAVLPDGRLLNTITHVKKDNTGPNLMYDFIGSEGAFGIITSALVKMHAVPKQQKVALFALESPEKTMELFQYFQKHHAHEMSAFEYMSGTAFKKGKEGKQDPFDREYPDYVLVELSSHLQEETGHYRYHLNDVFVHILDNIVGEDSAMVLDGVDQRPEHLWALREGITESLKHTAKKEKSSIIGNDISVPIESMPAFIREASKAVQDACRTMHLDVEFYPFGHVGDGNVHFNFKVNGQVTPEQRTLLKKEVWSVVQDFSGSVSAEHGVGRHNIAAMELKNPVEIDLLRRKKQLYDPKGLMNQGVMFDSPNLSKNESKGR